MAASSQVDKKEADKPSQNGTATNADYDGNGKKLGAVVDARPLPRSDAAGLVRRACVLSACGLTAVGCHRIGATVLARSSVTIGCLVACLPYLFRSSKYCQDSSLGCVIEDGDRRRPVSDILVWTSLVYMVPAGYGIMVHQYGIAVLQMLTTVGSALFHLSRETKFFNLDNVFATSLLNTTLWGFYLGVKHAGIWWYVATIGLAGPSAIYFIVRCGMPGLVCQHPSGRGLCRKSNPKYTIFHMLWHLASGSITLVTIHFFAANFPGTEAGGGWFRDFHGLPVVPTVSLAASALINFIGNYVGIMPLD
ncbi:unnamed protein product [Ascophyllum nodosum]